MCNMKTIIFMLLTVSWTTASSSMSVEEFKALPIPNYVNHMSEEEFVDYINKEQPFYKAEVPKMSREQFKSRLMDLKYIDLKVDDFPLKKAKKRLSNDIPESYDSREVWPKCKSIKLIRDQANCGSCWAVSAASVMSDRLCIQTYHNETTLQTLVSDTDILACCGERCGYGCNGGYMTEAWKYVVYNGTCSGGPYFARDCCKPYAFHPCGQHKDQPYYGECEKSNEDTPTCRKRCQFQYKKPYEKDKIHVLYAYYVYSAVEEIAMQRELMEYGPFQAAFIVYEDFRYYKSGVYVHKYGAEAGGHAVKVIGWGVENGVKYWLVSNSWNSDWGDNGYFKILRGENECGIEGPGMAGVMLIPK